MKNSRIHRAPRIYDLLLQEYPDVRCTLERISEAQFLLINILSPQCTDIVANSVSQKLWDTFHDIKTIAETPPTSIEPIIRPCGMYRIKAQAIYKTARRLVYDFGGKLPQTLEELVTFPGIGRKTALVILQEQFGIVAGIIVDTHGIRLAHRIGLSDATSAYQVENDLTKQLEKRYWKLWSHLMVHHGRAVCMARNPRCYTCVTRYLCDYAASVMSKYMK